MPKATPGPWNCNRSSASGYNIVCSDNSPTDVCVISRRGKTTGEIDANARLIAAAPELLEALTLLVAGIENSVSKTYIPLVRANAAIAKATGEAT